MTVSFPRSLCWIAWLWCLGLGCAWAQQDTADRLWQGAEQQSRQIRRQTLPSRPEGQGSWVHESMLSAWQVPEARVGQLTLAILNAVNQHDWFGADRLLRQYRQVPRHDPALFTFVEASRLAALGDHADAIDRYRQVLRANPLFTRGDLDLARVLFIDNRLRDAREIFQRLQARQLPPEIERHVADYLAAIEQRTRMRITLSLSAVREDNLNNASTIVDPCALRFLDACFENVPGRKAADTGAYFEGTLNKLWPLAGNHAFMLRSLNYGNRYRHEDDYGNLASTTYLGYQYGSARNQFQFLPLFEYDREGGHKAYHAFGFRTSISRQLSPRAMLEASYETKYRHFAQRLESLEGDFRSMGLFGQYVIRPDLLVYGSLAWRESGARLGIFAYREKSARLGIYKSFGGKVAVSMAYGYRQRQADEAVALFEKRQRDHEGSLYVNVSLPGYAWHGMTPTLSYEYRKNRSSIPHLHTYEKNRLTLGFTKVF